MASITTSPTTPTMTSVELVAKAIIAWGRR